MLHKGKLQTALNFKRSQFTTYDSSFSDQLHAYRHALETLYLRYPSGAQLEHTLPPDGSGIPPSGARPSIEFDRWLVHPEQHSYHGPYCSFEPAFANHEQPRHCAESTSPITTPPLHASH